MEIVVDSNILFAALIKQGKTAELLFRNDFSLYAPEFLLEEFKEYKKILENKTDRTEEDFSILLTILQHRITFITKEEIDPFLEEAKLISPDLKDITYLALALKLNCSLWSNDKALKQQSRIKVYNTNEIALL